MRTKTMQAGPEGMQSDDSSEDLNLLCVQRFADRIDSRHLRH